MSAPTSSPRAAETKHNRNAAYVRLLQRCNQRRPLLALQSMSSVAMLPRCMPPVLPSRWRALRIDGTLHLMHDVGLEELYHTLYVKASAEARAACVPCVCRVPGVCVCERVCVCVPGVWRVLCVRVWCVCAGCVCL